MITCGFEYDQFHQNQKHGILLNEPPEINEPLAKSGGSLCNSNIAFRHFQNEILQNLSCKLATSGSNPIQAHQSWIFKLNSNQVWSRSGWGT